MTDIKEVIHFWFEELTPKDWFTKNSELDEKITSKFQIIHSQAAKGELFTWRQSAEGRLAEIIVLDQFSRNMFRNKPQAFASDPIALVLSQEAISAGVDKTLAVERLAFLYMPFMHSESKVIHEQSIKLFAHPGLEFNHDYALKHKAIIDRFGRYPHRNQILGRESTAEEIEFLKQPGSSF